MAQLFLNILLTVILTTLQSFYTFYTFVKFVQELIINQQMKQLPIQLKGNKIQLKTKPARKVSTVSIKSVKSIKSEKSQNEGNSTNLSEDSKNIDEEFNIENNQNLQFINQKTQNWPQWSVNEQKKPEAENKANIQESVDDGNQDYQDEDFMYSRGWYQPLPQQQPSYMRPLNREKRIRDQPQQPKKTSVANKIKNWWR